MAHEINVTKNGASIVLARTPAWHRLGTVLEKCFTFQKALKAAHIDWVVEKRQLLNPLTKQPIDAWATFRADTGEMLGAVGHRYVPIQNTSIGDVMDAIVGAQDGAHYEVVGALGRGERLFALVNLREALRIKGTQDVSNVYLLGTNAHDGSQTNRYYTTAVRVVCANTWRMAESRQGNKLEFRIRHTGEIDEKIKLAREVMSDTRKDIQSFNEKLNYLATRSVGQDTIRDIVTELFPKVKDDPEHGIKASTVQQNRARDVLVKFEHNDGNAIPQIRGTALNLWNAVTEHVDHGGRALSGDAQMQIKQATRAVFGRGEDFKQQALDAILRAVDIGPKANTIAGVNRIMAQVSA